MDDSSSRYAKAAAAFNGDVFSLKGGMVIAVVASVALWLAVYLISPPLGRMADVTTRLVFALKCVGVTVLLCVLTGIEAVAHERLHSVAFDPLAGQDSMRLKVNTRYLQNTLEQITLFVLGLLILATYCTDARQMRAVTATAVVWMVARASFWIGYHHGPQYRIFGLTGFMQSLLVLLYVTARFGYEFGGVVGALLPLLVFGAIEVFLVRVTRKPSGTPPVR